MRFITENLTLKLFSLVVAGLLFVFVALESTTPIDVEFPVEYHTADDILIVNDQPSKVSVTLKGPWANFRGLLVDDLDPLVIDVTDAKPGSMKKPVNTVDLEAPAGMTVVAVSPSSLDLVFDRKTEKKIPINVDFNGRPAFGYDIEEMRVEPPRVGVVGPREMMKAIDFVHTEPVNLAERVDDLTLKVALRPPQPSRLIKLVDKKDVEVFIQIGEEMIERPFELPVRVVNAPKGSRATPDQVRITLKGPRRIVDKLDTEELEVVVDALPESEDGTRVFDKPVELRPSLPERTQIEGTLPVVKVTVARKRRRKG